MIDDDVDALSAMRLLLEARGAHVMVAGNGFEGLEQLAQRTPDAILCDLAMPGMGGLEFARRLRSQPRYQRVLLIAVTGRSRLADITDTWRAGFNGHLAKPLSPATLEALMQRIGQHARPEEGQA